MSQKLLTKFSNLFTAYRHVHACVLLSMQLCQCCTYFQVQTSWLFELATVVARDNDSTCHLKVYWQQHTELHMHGMLQHANTHMCLCRALTARCASAEKTWCRITAEKTWCRITGRCCTPTAQYAKPPATHHCYVSCPRACSTDGSAVSGAAQLFMLWDKANVANQEIKEGGREREYFHNVLKCKGLECKCPYG